MSANAVQSAHNAGLLPACKETPHVFVIVAIGANLPSPDGAPPLESCARAVRAVAALPGVSNPVQSRWYSSAPVPPSGQPRYINGVLRLTCSLNPVALLSALHAIEHGAGRTRSMPNAARTLDLDIIDMNALIRAAPDPILPHPRAHLRRFVLLPLRDVAPQWRHPVLGLNIATLLHALPPEDIHPT